MSANQELPEPLRTQFEHAIWTRVWSNEVGVETFRVERPDDTTFVKLASEDAFPSLAEEAARMRWAQAHLPVPEVLDCGRADGRQWLVTSEVPGIDASRDVHTAQPERTVRLLASGLRRFHELSVDDCPYSFRLDDALRQIQGRVERNEVYPDKHFHPVHAGMTAREALAKLVRERPQNEDLVVCHGDYCFPNVLIEGGEITGFVDLGELGVADRWWDIAVGAWSTNWNVGPGYEQLFVETYGEPWNQDRIDYYRLLYDLAS